MRRDAKIYVAGHRGLAGSAILRRLEREGCANVVTRTSAELDLRDRAATFAFFEAERPEYVFLAAAKVGGIKANMTQPVEFLRDNLLIELNVIDAAHEYGVEKLLFLGSSCIYPKHAEQPIREEALLTGPLEPTNQPYAIAKIAGMELCQAYRRQYGDDFICAMPTNLYGPGDNYDPDSSHVMAALIRRFSEAVANGDEVVTCWGTGTPRREFLHADDLADACLVLMDSYSDAMPINVGTGEDISIRELAELIAESVGFEGRIEWDTSMPDGTPRKVLDVSRVSGLLGQAWTSSRPVPSRAALLALSPERFSGASK